MQHMQHHIYYKIATAIIPPFCFPPCSSLTTPSPLSRRRAGASEPHLAAALDLAALLDRLGHGLFVRLHPRLRVHRTVQRALIQRVADADLRVGFYQAGDHLEGR